MSTPLVVARGNVDPALVTEELGTGLRFEADPDAAQLAAAFGMEVVSYDPYVDGAPGQLELAQLAARADVISLHLPLTEETRGLVGEEFLARMRPGGVLINCGRGGLVDLDAAQRALEDGTLSGLGLDVFDQEPPPTIRCSSAMT